MKTLKTVEERAEEAWMNGELDWSINDIASLLTAHTQDIIEMIEGMKHDDTCGDCDGTAVNTHLRNGEDCTYCHGTGVDGSAYTHNQTLSDIQAKLRATLDSK